ncbi:MAG: translation elongation factor-like protein [Patescibacteria group bacterium]
MKPVGKVTHYYDKLGVAIVELAAGLAVGDKIKFEGHGSDFEQTVSSMQMDHEEVQQAKKGDIIGLQATGKVREGAIVLKVEAE